MRQEMTISGVRFEEDSAYPHVIRINGVRYDVQIFRLLADPDSHHHYKFARGDDVVTVTDLGEIEGEKEKKPPRGGKKEQT